MTEQSTNGPVNGGAPEQATQERGAELSAQMARPPDADSGDASRDRARQRRRPGRAPRADHNRPMRTAMTEGVDYGTVPGTDRPGLFKPGAEKLAVLFRLDVQPRNELIWGPGEHLTVISRATVHDAPSGTRIGYGEGICTTRERKYAKRHQKLACPECGAANIRKSKNPGEGWYCWRKTDGCGATFAQDDQRISSQTPGEIDNPDLPDSWNSADKIAKKRSFVDAVLSVTGASAIFTQDLGADPTETAAGAGHGPVVAGELKQAATRAAIELCGGDVDRAGTLWATVQAELGGYMPEAAARALLLAAETDARSDREPRDERANTAAPDAPDTAAGDPSADGEAGAGAPANPSPHGARLRAIATDRGVGDAELANLIRSAVAQGPIPADRARTRCRRCWHGSARRTPR